MRKRKKAWSRKRVMITLTFLLFLFFLYDSAMLSLTIYCNERLNGVLGAKTIILYDAFGRYDPEAAEKRLTSLVEKCMEDLPGVKSYIQDYKSASFTGTLNDRESEFNIWGCDYEAVSDYVLTEGCHAPEGNEVLIPRYMLLGGVDIGGYLFSARAIQEMGGSNITDGSDLVGTAISGTVSCSPLLTIELGEMELKVIGVYDNLTMGETDVFFVSPETLKAWNEIAEEKQGDIPEEERLAVDNGPCFVITAESREEYHKLDEYLTEMEQTNTFNFCYHFCRTPIDEMEEEFFHDVLVAGNFILVFLFLNLVINIIYAEEHQIYLRRREYGILKAVGYMNSRIALLHLKEMAGNILKALAAAFSMGVVIMTIANLVMAPFLNFLYRTFRVKLYGNVILLTILLGTLPMLVGYLVGIYKLSKLEPMEALRNKE